MTPYIGQIEAFAFNFAPQGWAICAGQTLPIAQNQALFALIGTTYGGNGTSTFQLPDLRGHVTISQGAGPGLSPRTLGEAGGQEQHTLVLTEMPAAPHSHAVNAVNNATSGGTNVPGSGVMIGSAYETAGGAVVNVYGSGDPVAMGALGNSGGQAHENRMPFLAMTYCIALQGIFPSRN